MTNENIIIPVYQPLLSGNEKKYVNECLDTNWISSKGKFVSQFEQKFAEYINLPYVTTVSNGTTALHLALLALDIGVGDEVIVPTFTYVASVNAIKYVGATPVFVDSLKDTWQLDPADVRHKITPKTRAVMAVHLYGHPCEMGELSKICKENGLFLIEDCAEALGSFYENKHVGSWGDVSTFSFYGNKTLTTGEGGMLVTHDPAIYQKAVHLKGQGLSSDRVYWHDAVGYNYRMTNICAAIGLAQIERIAGILAKKREIATWYQEDFQHLPLQFHQAVGDVCHSFWMCSILVNERSQRDLLGKHLLSAGIETRPAFYPVHTMPMYFKPGIHFLVADHLGSSGMNLPSWPGLTREQVRLVTDTIRNFFVMGNG